MNLNDYTYHICDRFVLLFIAFMGLVGTSYILVSGNLNSSSSYMSGFSTDFNVTFHNNAINHGLKASSAVEENKELYVPLDSEIKPLDNTIIEASATIAGK